MSKRKEGTPSKSLNIEEFIIKKQSKTPSKKSCSNPVPVNFALVKNDHNRSSFRKIIDFKCIISKQLPKMPREYITKLLFDGKHQSLLAENEQSETIGGICFRPFEGQHFVEVVFLAVENKYRDRRVGTQIMDRLKELLQQGGKNLILTYADNTALGFFRKQGFEAVLETPTCSWNGYIKTYLEGTLMQCKVFDRLKYTKFKPILQENKMLIASKAKITPEFKYSWEMMEDIKSKPPNKFLLQMIPGLLGSGWSYPHEVILQSSKEYSFVLQQLNAVELLRKFPEAYVFRGLTELPMKNGKERSLLKTWGSIEKWIISAPSKEIAAVDKAITKMTGKYKHSIDSASKEGAIIREFQKKMGVVLNDLLARRLSLNIDSVFKEKEKPRKSSKQKVAKN